MTTFINKKEQGKYLKTPDNLPSITPYHDNNLIPAASADVDPNFLNVFKGGVTPRNWSKSERAFDADKSQSYDDAKSFKFSLVGDALSASEEARLPEAPEYRFDRDNILQDFIQDQEDLDFVVISTRNKEQPQADLLLAVEIADSPQTKPDSKILPDNPL